MSDELLTPAERARVERNESINADYVEIMRQHPGIKPMRIYRVLSGKYSLSMTQIRSIILGHA